jgi:hypothetical protein
MADGRSRRDGAAGPLDPGGAQESALRELLRSPLDEEPGRSGSVRRARWASLLSFLAAAGLGAGATAGIAVLADGGPATTTTEATTTTGPAASGPALPAGYRALGDGFGARVERVLLRPDAAFVTISLAVDEEHDPAETGGLQGGHWQLEFPDGSSVRSTGVAFDPVARAAATIAFPPLDADPAGATLRLIESAVLHGETLSATVSGTVPALPAEGTLDLTLAPAAFTLDGGGTLSAALELGSSGGTLSWSLEGEKMAGHVTPAVVLEGPSATVLLVAVDPFFSFHNRMLSLPPPDLAAEGRVALTPLDVTHPDPGAGFTVTATFEVTWATWVPSDAELPLDGAVVEDLGGTG